MSSIFGYILLSVLPFQYFPPVILNLGNQPVAESRVEGVSTENRKSEVTQPNFTSLKGSLEDIENKNSDRIGDSGMLPQRTKNFKDIKIFAGSSVVIDADSGTILHYDNGRSKNPIASLTKIMTATIVMENVKDLDEQVTIDKEALLADGTKVGCPTSVNCVSERLHEGEKVSVKDLLMAMLLDSANDAAIALGKHVAGSQKNFAIMMNEKAEELNLGDSNFCNPSGLDEDNCYSSAYDLARITAYSMKYDLIWKIMKTQEVEIVSCDGKYSHQLKNTDLLLDQMPNCLGGKTGFTYNAGKSLMMAATDPEKNQHKIIAVILNDNKRWEDMNSLINWTFDNYEWK